MIWYEWLFWGFVVVAGLAAVVLVYMLGGWLVYVVQEAVSHRWEERVRRRSTGDDPSEVLRRPDAAAADRRLAAEAADRARVRQAFDTPSSGRSGSASMSQARRRSAPPSSRGVDSSGSMPPYFYGPYSGMYGDGHGSGHSGHDHGSSSGGHDSGPSSSGGSDSGGSSSGGGCD